MRILSLVLAGVLIMTTDASAFGRRSRQQSAGCQGNQASSGCQGNQASSGCQGSQGVQASGCQGSPYQGVQAAVPGCAPVAAGACTCGPDCPCPNCPNKGLQTAPKAAPKAPAKTSQAFSEGMFWNNRTGQWESPTSAPAITPLLGRMLYNARTGQYVYCANCPQSP